jgi:hypothetical protein
VVDNLGFESQHGKEIFLFYKTAGQTDSRAHRAPYSMVTGVLSGGEP